jgi:acetylglutamate kinase
MTRKKPNFFIDAFYESKFKDNLFVIKAGGKIIEDTKILDNLMANIRDLTLHGIKILLIYGHGRLVDEKLEQRGIPVNKIEGRRVTDAATMDAIKEVVGGTLSLNIASSMARNNVEGISLNAIPFDWMKLELRPKNPIDYGFVSDVKSVESRPLARLFRNANFVACSCVGVTHEGQILNINADTIATEMAIGTRAHKLMFLSDVDGVLIDGKSADIITAQQIPALIKNGTVTGGMKVKLENCLAALNSGVKRIHLISGLRPDALKKEIYESVGPGTMLFHESESEAYANEVEAQKVIERQRKKA